MLAELVRIPGEALMPPSKDHSSDSGAAFDPGAVSDVLLPELRCPESHSRLVLADKELLERLNRQIAAGAIRNAGGSVVERAIDGGLVREDGRILYPVLDGIPIMLIDEGIPLEPLS